MKRNAGHIVCQMEPERGVDRSASIADMRFDFYRGYEQTVVKPRGKQRTDPPVRRSMADRYRKYTAIPCFIVIMILVFFVDI